VKLSKKSNDFVVDVGATLYSLPDKDTGCKLFPPASLSKSEMKTNQKSVHIQFEPTFLILKEIERGL
jgi:hypothetical protein